MSRPRNNGGGLIIAIIGVILLIALLESLLEIIIPLAIVGGIGYGIYYFTTKQSRLEKVNTKQRLQDLKDKIRIADRQVKLLTVISMKNYTQYVVNARQLLPQIRHIKSELSELKAKMDLNIYKRVLKG